MGLSECVHESAEPHVCFVNLCAQVKEDLFAVAYIGPDVKCHVCLLDMVGNHEHLAVFFLSVEKDLHCLNVALSDESVSFPAFTTLCE